MPEEEGIIFSPETFARHEAAVRYIQGRTRTRDALGREKRFPRIIPGAWGKLAAGDTITAASGLSLGTGTIKLCDRDGTVADDAEDIDVSNAGGELTGGTGGAIVPLEWTQGEWSTCGCISEPPTGFSACGCTDVPETLRFTDSVLGLTILTKISGINIWVGDRTYSYPGFPGLPCNGGLGCPGALVSLHIVLDGTTGTTCHISVNWQVSGSLCPTAGTSGPNFVFKALTVTCSPFHATASLNLALELCQTKLLYTADTGTVNYTITP